MYKTHSTRLCCTHYYFNFVNLGISKKRAQRFINFFKLSIRFIFLLNINSDYTMDGW